MFGRNRYGTTRYGASGGVSVFYKALSAVVSASGSIARKAGLVQYTLDEKEKLPSAALAALKLRGPATSESTPAILERIQLIERYLRIEVQ